ncbi:hypothetical protein AOLI_G00253930 [Acnodon oligacanthus]
MEHVLSAVWRLHNELGLSGVYATGGAEGWGPAGMAAAKEQNIPKPSTPHGNSRARPRIRPKEQDQGVEELEGGQSSDCTGCNLMSGLRRRLSRPPKQQIPFRAASLTVIDGEDSAGMATA